MHQLFLRNFIPHPVVPFLIGLVCWLTDIPQVECQPRFHKISTEQGLSESTVNAIFQDNKGFLWFGTANGLNRYDGYGFTVFRHTPFDSASLPSSDIAALGEDGNGTLWIGTITGGLGYLDRRTDRLVGVPLRAGKRTVTIISSLVARGSDVWIGSDAAGLFHLDTRTKAVQWIYWDGGPVREPNITALAAGSDNTCWAGTGSGIVYQVAKAPFRALRRLIVCPPKDNVRITQLFEDSCGRLWIATGKNGLFRLDPGQVQPRRVWYVPGQAGGTNDVFALAEDRQKNLWIGTDDGVMVAPRGDVTQLRHYRAAPDSDEGLSSHAVKSIREDRSGNVWIGTWEAGLNVIYQQAEPFRALTYLPGQPKGLLTRKVTAIGGDPGGHIWLGSNAGLLRWQPATNRFEPMLPPRIGRADVNLLVSPSHGPVLVSIWNRGFYRWHPRTRRFVQVLGRSNPGDTLPPDYAKAVGPASNGKLWVSAAGSGVVRLDPATGQVERFPPTPDGFDLSNIHPNALLETAGGTLWMGMFNDGLWAYHLSSGRVRHYTAGAVPGALSESQILVLFEDSRKRLWVGTNGGGLNLFDPKTGRFLVYTTQQGLASNTVKGVLEDDRGYLWVSTNHGLSRFDPASETALTFTVYDGLPSAEFLTGSAYRSADGHLYFGSLNGLLYFHPDSLRINPDTPPVYLTGLRLFNRPVLVGESGSPLEKPLAETKILTLGSHQSVFTLDFLALHMRAAPNLRYAYRLEPLDPDWNYVGTQRSATYTNLDPGDYVFRVKVAQGAGAWSEPGTSLPIRILPPWHRTWWAFLLYTLAGFAVLSAWRRIIRIRERLRSDLRVKTTEAEAMRRLDQLKTTFFTNISHEFRTPLTLILTPLEQLLNRPVPTDPQQLYSLMHRNAQRLLQLINQLLDLSKLEAGHWQPQPQCNALPDAVGRLVESFLPAATQRAQTLTMTSDFPGKPVWYDPDILEKVLSNLLSNALKFTPDGGQVHVSLRQAGEGEIAEIRVMDSGVGIAPDQLRHIFDRFYRVAGASQSKTIGTGIGLALSKELIELVGGTLAVASEVSRGSTFTVRLPVSSQSVRIPAPPSPLPDSAPAQHSEPAQTTPLPASTGRPTLLIAEDNDELRAYIRTIFSRRYTVLEAPDGRAGWQQALTAHPELIISDVMMPHTNGIDLCRQIKTHPQTSHIPVILLTARQHLPGQLDGFGAGADDYITKPFNAQLLTSRVDNLLRNRQQLRERFGRSITVQPSQLTATSADEQFLTNVLQLVERNLANPDFTVGELESAMSLSETLLYRKLKTLTGLSGNEFIRSIRMKRAAQWLQSEAGLTVSEVAYRVGFRDPAYFTRCFTKEFGQSPRQFSARSSSFPREK